MYEYIYSNPATKSSSLFSPACLLGISREESNIYIFQLMQACFLGKLVQWWRKNPLKYNEIIGDPQSITMTNRSVAREMMLVHATSDVYYDSFLPKNIIKDT